MTYEERMKVCEELGRFAELEGAETGDVCNSLISIASNVGDYTSEGFQKAFDKELVLQLIYFKSNYKIVREQETVTRPVERLEEKTK